MSEARTETTREFAETSGKLALWFGVLTGPIAFLLNLQATYMLTPFVCTHGGHVALYIIPGVFAAIVAAAGVVALRDWRRTGSEWPAHEGGIISRSRFMAELGMAASILFLLVLLAQWIPNFFLTPCQ